MINAARKTEVALKMLLEMPLGGKGDGESVGVGEGDVEAVGPA